MNAGAAAPRYRTEISWLFQAALVVFVATVAIGLVNGQQIVTLSRDVILTHVHSGTIGWVTLGFFAAILWILGGPGAAATDRLARWTAILMAVSTPVYVAAFWSGNLPARAIFGVPLLLGIVLFLFWMFREAIRIGARRITTSQLGAVLGIVTLVIGSALGVYVQFVLASGGVVVSDPSSGGPIAAHVTAQAYGYVLLVAIALTDWRLLPGDQRSKRGFWVAGLLFAGGLILALGLLSGNTQLSGLYVPLDIAAVIVFLTRSVPAIARTSWGGGSGRHYAIAVPFLVFDIILIAYLIVAVLVLRTIDFASVPRGIFLAGFHASVVGGVTNILFGLLHDLTGDRRLWPWADGLVFWGMNAGLLGFIAVLLVEARELYRFPTPVMGAAILLGIAVYLVRLRSGPAAEPTRAAAAMRA